jgi:hypothetical protein
MMLGDAREVDRFLGNADLRSGAFVLVSLKREQMPH